MTKRKIDSNWKKLLASGDVKHKKKKTPKVDYVKKTKDGKKEIWFDIDKGVLDSTTSKRFDFLVSVKLHPCSETLLLTRTIFLLIELKFSIITPIQSPPFLSF